MGAKGGALWKQLTFRLSERFNAYSLFSVTFYLLSSCLYISDRVEIYLLIFLQLDVTVFLRDMCVMHEAVWT